MEHDVSSRTAEFMALFRALESAQPQSRRLFDDSRAKWFLSPSLRVVAGLSRLPGIYTIFMEIIDRKWPGARTSAIARTRTIDDIAVAALSDGIRQVVLLGAGFDSRPYRLKGMDKALVFEVDHPATSARKQSIVRRFPGGVPENVRFVPMDFNDDDLNAELKRAGFNNSLSTFVIWEGVSNYLTKEAVDKTLTWCAKVIGGGRVVFTYIDNQVLLSPASFYGTEKVSNLLSGVGEKWTFGMDPKEVKSYVLRMDLKLENDLSAIQYRQMYYADRSAKMKGYEFYHVAVASFAK